MKSNVIKYIYTPYYLGLFKVTLPRVEVQVAAYALNATY